jgi:hypothetical protein
MLTPQPVASQTTSAAVAAAAAVTANEDDEDGEEDEQEVRNRCALACWTVLLSVFVSSYPHLPSPCLHLGLPPTRHVSFVLSFNFFQVWSRACLGSRSCRSCPLMFLLFSFCFFPPSLVAIYRHLSTLCWAAASPPPHLPASLLPFLSVSFLFLPLSTSSFFSPASQGVKLTHACVNAPPPLRRSQQMTALQLETRSTRSTETGAMSTRQPSRRSRLSAICWIGPMATVW